MVDNNKEIFDITQDRLKEYLHYNKYTGLFTWIKPTSNRVKIGHIVQVNTKRCQECIFISQGNIS